MVKPSHPGLVCWVEDDPALFVAIDDWRVDGVVSVNLDRQRKEVGERLKGMREKRPLPLIVPVPCNEMDKHIINTMMGWPLDQTITERVHVTAAYAEGPKGW